MHILILSKLNAQAQERLLSAADTLARYFGLPSDLVQALTVHEKDHQVRALREREATAALLEKLAIQVGAVSEAVDVPVTPVTVEETSAPALDILAPDGSVATVSIQVEEAPDVVDVPVTHVTVDETSAPAKSRKKKGS